MSILNPMPFIKLREFDSDGKLLSGGIFYFYEAGTDTPKAVYSDAGGTTSLGSVVTLDSAGSSQIFLGTGNYHVILAVS